MIITHRSRGISEGSLRQPHTGHLDQQAVSKIKTQGNHAVTGSVVAANV